MPGNRVKHNESNAAYLSANRPAARARVNAWRAAHPDAARAWREANRPRLRVYESRSQAKRSLAPGSFTAADLAAQFNAQCGCCFYCAIPLRKFHIEHKTPLARGGSNFPDNIVCSCAACNLRKGTRTADEFFAVLFAERAQVA